MHAPAEAAARDMLTAGCEDSVLALSVEFEPLRSTAAVAAMARAMAQCPPETPHRIDTIFERLQIAVPGEVTSKHQLPGLLSRLDSSQGWPGMVKCCSAVISDETVVLVPDVQYCVVCSAAGDRSPLRIAWPKQPASPTIYTESGARRGELYAKSCRVCGAVHNMSCAAGGLHLATGVQLYYDQATNARWFMARETVVETSLLRKYDAQALHSHTGMLTYAHEYSMITNDPSLNTERMRRAVTDAWLAWTLLVWRTEVRLAMCLPDRCASA